MSNQDQIDYLMTLIEAGLHRKSDEDAFNFVSGVLDEAADRVRQRCYKLQHFVSNKKPYVCRECQDIMKAIQYEQS